MFNIMKSKKRFWGIGISAILALVLLFMFVGVPSVILVNNPDLSGEHTLSLGQLSFTIGTDAYAAGTADYVCDGVNDDVQFQAALDALPVGGGRLVVLAGNYSFGAVVVRAIDNVTIEGIGMATVITRDGVNTIFDAGVQASWVFSNMNLDAGGVDIATATDWIKQNLLEGTAYTGLTTPFENTYTISPDGGDYTTIQDALDANNTGGELFLLYNGTYTGDTINFSANNQCIRGMGLPSQQVVTAPDATIVNYGARTGCRIDNLTISLTAPTTAVDMITGSGSLELRWCNLLVSNTLVVVADQPTAIDGTGSVDVLWGNIIYNNTADDGGGVTAIKAPIRLGIGANVFLCRVTIDIDGANQSLASTLAYSVTTGITDVHSCIITVDDTDTTNAVGVAYLNAVGTFEFRKNEIHVTGGAGNTAYGILQGGTSTVRFMYNLLHVLCPGGTAYSYSTAVGATTTAQFDDIIAANGQTGAGTYTLVSSEADGELTVSGNLEAATGRGATFVVAASDADALSILQADYICDGTADDVQIQAALTALPASGGKVLLAEGNYQITANLTIPADAHLEGTGKGTILTTTAAIGITNMVILNGDNITVSDMKLVLGAGAGDVGSRPNVIYAIGRTLIWLENLWIIGDTSVADDASEERQNGVLWNTVTQSKIINCRVEDNDRNGIRLTSSDYNTLGGNTTQGNTINGVYLTSSDFNTIEGNIVQSNSEYGMRLSSNTNNTIVGNIVESNSQHGIIVWTSINHTITGNTCQGNGRAGIYLIANADKNTITGNTCQGNTWHGIYLSNTSINNTISGNTCTDNDSGGNTYSGIYVDGSDENTVTGNQCDGNGLHGIFIYESSYCVVTGNGSHNQNTGDGIHIAGDAPNADYNTITGNACTGNGDDGIEISEVGAGDANKNIVLGNELLGNGGAALVDGGTNTDAGHNIVA